MLRGADAQGTMLISPLVDALGRGGELVDGGGEGVLSPFAALPVAVVALGPKAVALGALAAGQSGARHATSKIVGVRSGLLQSALLDDLPDFVSPSLIPVVVGHIQPDEVIVRHGHAHPQIHVALWVSPARRVVRTGFRNCGLRRRLRTCL